MEKRLVVTFSFFTVLSFLLFFRVGALSSSETLSQVAQTQSTYSLTVETTRGQIYDSRFIPMVNQEKSYVASCLPMPENMDLLLRSGALEPFSTKVTLSELIKEGRPFLAKCSRASLDIPGVTVFAVDERYAEETMASHILGYLNSEGKGVTGIEKAYNDYLTRNSSESVISYKVDATGAPLLGVSPSVSLAPVQTQGVVLTLDSRIQKIVEEVGSRMLERGSVVVMEPSTGKIRACASFPTYSVENLAEAVQDQEASPLLNRFFCTYNVGSTFKIATAAAALTQGISPATELFCGGKVNVLSQTFKCHDLNGHGLIDLRKAMEVSCNPYFIQLGGELDRAEFVSMASALSFGKQSVFADGFAPAKGYLPTTEELFNPAALGNFSFGQGTLMATPIQIAQMVSAVVNEGKTPGASLVEGLTTDGKIVDQREAPMASTQAMSPYVAKQIQSYLISSVMEVENQHAKPQYVTAGGKTGTAQTGQYGDDGEELLQGWFAGFFPAEEPQYVVVVLSENCRTGNQDASPVFREIADQLNAPLIISDSSIDTSNSTFSEY